MHALPIHQQLSSPMRVPRKGMALPKLLRHTWWSRVLGGTGWAAPVLQAAAGTGKVNGSSVVTKPGLFSHGQSRISEGPGSDKAEV